MHILFWRGACRRRFYGQALRGLMMMGALVIALGLFLVGCGSGGSGGSDNGGPGGGAPTCDITDDLIDCDGDGALNGEDNCVGTANSDQTNSDTDDVGDACDTDDDNDDEPDETDVDADGDGLIEIANAVEFNNIRHNLAGSSYDDEAADGSAEETGR